MKALQGIEGRVEWAERPAPEPKDGELRIRVAAAGINRADYLQRSGHYPPPPGVTDTIGLECAGVVERADSTGRYQEGDRVCALLAGGGIAEYATVDARHVLPVPKGLSLAEAAAIPEVYATAWLNRFRRGRLQPGEKLLLHAGASGVGSAAIQLCKAFGNPCWVSVGSAERLAYCESLGAAGGALRNVDLDSLRDFGPFDVVLDPVGASYAALNAELLAVDGRWVLIGLMGGREATVDLAKVLRKRIQLTGSVLRTRSADFKAELLESLHQAVWPLFEDRRLSPRLERTFPIDEAETAFQTLGSNAVNGKIALVIDPSLD